MLKWELNFPLIDPLKYSLRAGALCIGPAYYTVWPAMVSKLTLQFENA